MDETRLPLTIVITQRVPPAKSALVRGSRTVTTSLGLTQTPWLPGPYSSTNDANSAPVILDIHTSGAYLVHTMRMSVTLSDPQNRWLKAEAKKLGLSVGELLRRIVDEKRAAAAAPPQQRP